jgi:hypothetical protein
LHPVKERNLPKLAGLETLRKTIPCSAELWARVCAWGFHLGATQSLLLTDAVGAAESPIAQKSARKDCAVRPAFLK